MKALQPNKIIDTIKRRAEHNVITICAWCRDRFVDLNAR